MPIGDALESRFAMLEGGELGVDDELAKMKSAMGAPPKRARLSESLSETGYLNIPIR